METRLIDAKYQPLLVRMEKDLSKLEVIPEDQRGPYEVGYSSGLLAVVKHMMALSNQEQIKENSNAETQI